MTQTPTDLQTGLELERNFISSLFMDTSAGVASVNKELPDFSSDYFTGRQHALIYEAIGKRVNNGLPCGLEDVAEDLQGKVKATVISDLANYFMGLKEPGFREIRKKWQSKAVANMTTFTSKIENDEKKSSGTQLYSDIHNIQKEYF